MFCDYRMKGEILERVTQEKDLEVVIDKRGKRYGRYPP